MTRPRIDARPRSTKHKLPRKSGPQTKKDWHFTGVTTRTLKLSTLSKSPILVTHLKRAVLALNIVWAAAWAFILFYISYMLSKGRTVSALNRSFCYRVFGAVSTGAVGEGIAVTADFQEVAEAFEHMRGGSSSKTDLKGLAVNRCISAMSGQMATALRNHFSSNVERYLKRCIVLECPELRNLAKKIVQVVVAYPEADPDVIFCLKEVEPGGMSLHWTSRCLACLVMVAGTSLRSPRSRSMKSPVLVVQPCKFHQACVWTS